MLYSALIAGCLIVLFLPLTPSNPSTPLTRSTQGGSKLERTRELFEQALAACTPAHAKSLYLLYASFEEQHGMARHAMAVYERAADAVPAEDRFEVRGGEERVK